MLMHWQTNQEYLCFLASAKTIFDSSERVRLQSELASAREKLRLLDTDSTMHFLAPFYSRTGRPASNQPHLLRSFILFFLLISMNLTVPSLTSWIKRLKSDRVLAFLVGCPLTPFLRLAPTMISWTSFGLYLTIPFIRGINSSLLTGTVKMNNPGGFEPPVRSK